MSPEADVCCDGALEVDAGAERERAEVGAAEGLGRDANFKAGAVEGGDGEACSCMRGRLVGGGGESERGGTVDGYAVA